MSKRFLRNHIFLFALIVLNIVRVEGVWTTLHTWGPKDLDRSARSLVVSKSDLQPFTQLIFSWNAVRPSNGHFSFYVSVHGTSGEGWSGWHLMSSWGKTAQRSYFNKSSSGTCYSYAKLDGDKPSKKFDAFRVRVESRDEAPLRFLRVMAVCTCDMTSFSKELVGLTDGLPGVVVSGVPKLSQKVIKHEQVGDMCSSASCAMFAGYLLGKHVDPLDFALGAYDKGLERYGNWSFNIARLFEVAEGKFRFATARLSSFKDLHSILCCGRPVVVSVRGVIKGAPKGYENGHILVVVGFDDKKQKVLCHDPAFPDNDSVFCSYDVIDFVRLWECSRRLTYVVVDN